MTLPGSSGRRLGSTESGSHPPDSSAQAPAAGMACELSEPQGSSRLRAARPPDPGSLLGPFPASCGLKSELTTVLPGEEGVGVPGSPWVQRAQLYPPACTPG